MSRKQKKAEFELILSDVDVMLLQEGVQPGASEDETEKARQALEAKTDFTLVKKKDRQATAAASKKGSRRGPKSAASRNVTEDEERQRLETIRQLLGDQWKTATKKYLLRAVFDLLRIFRARCESGIFLRHDERAMLWRLLQNGSADAQVLEASIANGDLTLGHGWTETPSRGEITNWLEEFAEDCWDNAVRQTWRMFVDETPLAVAEIAPPKPASEKGLYDHIRIVLDLKADTGGLNDATQEAVPEAGKEPAGVQADGPVVSGEDDDLYPKRSVPETLRAACAALSMFRQIVDDCWFCRMNLGSESLYLMVRSLSLSNPVGTLPAIVEKLDSLFMTAFLRQRKQPFLLLANEDACLGAAEIPEDGQIGAF